MRNTYRVYDDEEVMLKVYDRRLHLADNAWDKEKLNRQRFVDRYRMVPESDQVASDGHLVTVSTGVSIIDTLYASMTSVDIEFLFDKVGPQASEADSRAATQAVNNDWRDTKGNRRAKKAVRDALLVDYGVVKVYYDYVEDEDTVERPDDEVEKEIISLLGEDYTPEQAESLLAEGTVQLVHQVPVVLRDRVCVDYVKWSNLRWDPTATEPEDATWHCQYTQVPLVDVKHNPKWRAFVLDRYGEEDGKRKLDDLRGDSTFSTTLQQSTIDTLPDDTYGDDDAITICEMHDHLAGLVTVFPKDSTELVLFQWVEPLAFNVDLEDRSAFKFLTVRDDPEQLTGLGDMRMMENGLDELDEYRTNLAEHVTRSVPKIFVPSRGITPAGLSKLQNQEWNALVEMGEGVDPSQVKPYQPASVQQEVYGVPERIQEELKEMTGANEVFSGAFTSKRTTAVEVDRVAGAGERRQSDRRSKLEEWYLDIGKAMLQLAQLYYDRDRVATMMTEAGEELAWKWNKQDIAAGLGLRVALTPQERKTRAERTQDAFTFLNIVLSMPETDRAAAITYAALEMGVPENVVTRMVKTPEEVQAEQEQQQLAQQLAVKPQPFGNSPPGLSIAPGGGG